ncbi:unnamed protein product [Ambrosiozyma monospora]|uniref:Unnamed protein product n=1 Tax=Ambrosiozyma monospora TaxID=43982 RepID=A0A9W6T6Q1_AMBMO|nr:unnamed protein product [Ambrosiozyma monospora]
MTDNDNFEFEEEKLLHSSRSFRDRQRIDYNENKRPPKSTATAPAHTVITRSTDHVNAKSTTDPPSTDSNMADKQHIQTSDSSSNTVVRISGHTTLTLKYGKQSPSPEEEATAPVQHKVKSGNNWTHKKASTKRRRSESPTTSKLHPGQVRGVNGRFQKKKKNNKGTASIPTANANPTSTRQSSRRGSSSVPNSHDMGFGSDVEEDDEHSDSVMDFDDSLDDIPAVRVKLRRQ